MKMLLVVLQFFMLISANASNHRSISRARALFAEAHANFPAEAFEPSKTWDCKQHGIVYNIRPMEEKLIAEYLEQNTPAMVVLSRIGGSTPKIELEFKLDEYGNWVEEYDGVDFAVARIHKNGLLIIERSSKSYLSQVYRQMNCPNENDCFKENSLIFESVPVRSYEVCK